MKTYNKFERTLGKIFDRFPLNRNFLKKIYQRLNYLIYSLGKVNISLHKNLTLFSAEE